MGELTSENELKFSNNIMVIRDICRCINIVIVFILKCYNNSFIMKLNDITFKRRQLWKLKILK